MRFDVQSELTYSVAATTVFIFNVQALPTSAQEIVSESLTLTPPTPFEEFTAPGGDSRFVRLEQPAVDTFTLSYRATIETRPSILERGSLDDNVLRELHPEVVPFVFPSRYCESDMLGRFAYRNFGSIASDATDYDRVVAITDWVHDNVEYVSGSTNAMTSAYDTVTQGAGVCRDFAHLSIALCRAMNIPARYFTGYAYQLDPPDFHACFEAFVSGRWMLFDATHLAPLNGLVRIGSGRDAADSSVATIFGPATLKSQKVRCQLASSTTSFVPLTHRDLHRRGLSHDAAP